MKMNHDKGMRMSVGIIGCGWLGSVLAKRLIQAGDEVIATATQKNTLTALFEQGIKAVKLELPVTSIKDELLSNTVFTMQQLVICIPPQVKKGLTNYPEKIRQLVQAAENSGVKRLILLSSTAVYGGLEGKIDENSALDISIEKVNIIAKAEQNVLNFKGDSCVVRLGGLIGPKRHPGRFLSGKKQLMNPSAPVNLIHQQDAIGIIDCLLQQEIIKSRQTIFNCVCSTHPQRKDFYQAAAKAMNLPQPIFVEEELLTIANTKKVCGNKVTQELGYKFVIDDLLLWVSCE